MHSPCHRRLTEFRKLGGLEGMRVRSVRIPLLTPEAGLGAADTPHVLGAGSVVALVFWTHTQTESIITIHHSDQGRAILVQGWPVVNVAPL